MISENDLLRATIVCNILDRYLSEAVFFTSRITVNCSFGLFLHEACYRYSEDEIFEKVTNEASSNMLWYG